MLKKIFGGGNDKKPSSAPPPGSSGGGFKGTPNSTARTVDAIQKMGEARANGGCSWWMEEGVTRGCAVESAAAGLCDG